METAKVTSKGQITIPRDVRAKMSLKQGDKVLFIEENGRFVLVNSAEDPLTVFQGIMDGKAEKAGFSGPDDVVNYIKSVRKKTRRLECGL